MLEKITKKIETEKEILSTLPQNNKKNKENTLKEYVGIEDENKDIKEPWGYDIEIYRMCEAEIEKCIDKLVEKIIKSEE